MPSPTSVFDSPWFKPGAEVVSVYSHCVGTVTRVCSSRIYVSWRPTEASPRIYTARHEINYTLERWQRYYDDGEILYIELEEFL